MDLKRRKTFTTMWRPVCTQSSSSQGEVSSIAAFFEKLFAIRWETASICISFLSVGPFVLLLTGKMLSNSCFRCHIDSLK